MAARSSPKRRPSPTSSTRYHRGSWCRARKRDATNINIIKPVSRRVEAWSSRDNTTDVYLVKMEPATRNHEEDTRLGAPRNMEPAIRRRWCYTITRLHRPLPRSCNVLPLSWRTTEYGVEPRRGALFMACGSQCTCSMLLVLPNHRIRRLARMGHQPRPSMMSPFFGTAMLCPCLGGPPNTAS
ncbi:hypothetical protein VPH35_077787 [Triticum aestivum]